MTMNSFLDPYDPLNGGDDWQGRRPDQVESAMKAFVGSVVMFLVLLVLMGIVSLFTSCTPQRIISDERSERVSQEMLSRMDSLLRVKTVVQQDSTWRQEILRQFQSIREKSDTSHSVTLNAAGDTIRERIIINNVRETTSETAREQLLVMSHRLEVMDSTVQSQSLMLQRMDSLLHEKQQTVEKEVPAQLSWFQQMQLWLGRLVLLVLALCAGWFIVRWWLRVKKVI